MAELRLEPRCVHLTIPALHQPPILCSTGHKFKSGSSTDRYVTLGKTFHFFEALLGLSSTVK